MFKKKKITVYYDSEGRGGNAFALLEDVKYELKKQKRFREIGKLCRKVENAFTTEEVIEYLRESAELIDVSKNKGNLTR